ncbi:MAG: hypothetical protein WBK20_10645 [Spirochaetota bacterium]
MKYTQHFAKQTHNRGITNTMVELVQLFGYEFGDRIVLDKKQTRQLLDEVNALRHELIKMYEKGGVALVEKNGALITAFAIQKRMGKIKKQNKYVG